MQKRLQEARCFTIDADAIAAGMLETFDDNERTVLRFGMLPAEKMECLQQIIRERFENFGGGVRLDKKAAELGLTWDGDTYVAYAKGQASEGDARPRIEIIEFSMKKLVQEAVHEVCVALYKIGNLVV